MREAFGGTWLMGIVLLFIVVFSGFLAISINYSKAFKVKNEILNLIEKNEGFSNTSGSYSGNSTEEKIQNYLDKIGYASATNFKCPENLYGENYAPRDGGYCVAKIDSKDGKSSYYKVTTFVKIELPLIWNSFSFPVSGETKVIYYDKGEIDPLERN